MEIYGILLFKLAVIILPSFVVFRNVAEKLFLSVQSFYFLLIDSSFVSRYFKKTNIDN